MYEGKVGWGGVGNSIALLLFLYTLMMINKFLISVYSDKTLVSCGLSVIVLE